MIRELIASNIVSTLKAITDSNRPKKVTREPFDFERLSNAQFPAVLIQTDSESRTDSTIAGDDAKREGVINYRLICYVKGAQIDNARNRIIELIENTLDVDRTRGGYAIDTQVTDIETDQGSLDPIGGVIINVRTIYTYNRGNS
jgi:hypothetical protein